MSESVGVTCTVAADNYVMGVKLINDNGLVQDLTIDYEGGVDWQNKKTVTFQQSNKLFKKLKSRKNTFTMQR